MSPLCTFKWASNCCLRLKPLSHLEQWNGRNPECDHKCSLSMDFRRKDCLHSGQSWRTFSSWRVLWARRFDLELKRSPHVGHSWDLRPRWAAMWIWRPSWVVRIFLHKWHGYWNIRRVTLRRKTRQRPWLDRYPFALPCREGRMFLGLVGVELAFLGKGFITPGTIYCIIYVRQSRSCRLLSNPT